MVQPGSSLPQRTWHAQPECGHATSHHRELEGDTIAAKGIVRIVK